MTEPEEFNRASHFTAFTAAATLSGVPHLLVARYERDYVGRPDQKDWKFLGGNAKRGETPLATLGRECEEETGLPHGPTPVEVFRRDIPETNHIKFFYLVSFQSDHFEQKVRREPLIDGREKVGPPEWRSVSWVLENIFRTERNSFHFDSAVAVVRHLAQTSPEFAFAGMEMERCFGLD